ncbi:Hsp20/alpha crystallin family protein [Glutamicibacter creatinolyticus]|uniref:Glucose-6-phosphate dehydrogenase n=1 Tax=Glutamicibacter creatinolyticus TaxID=162496 RepID=A0A5B7WWQ7_9MICC|nr:MULTISPECIES: Hsp20/alpha crystallin family protein [Glutamicibacter]QCY48337.1 Glucose-6-phosphate dehydrogenase [Glutamicibacter creatinolyticus]
MLLDNDVFREFDRMVKQAFNGSPGFDRAHLMPMDAWKDEQGFHAELEIPGIDPDAVELSVERNVLKIRATRPEQATDDQLLVRERAWGAFGRDLILSDHLDVDNIHAHYEDGLLRLDIPITEKSKPKRIAITKGNRSKELTS